MTDGIFQHPTLEPTPFPPQPLIDPNVPTRDQAILLSREQVRAMRELEVRGVPFFLHRTGVEATVKAFNIADETIMAGIAPHLQNEWTSVLNSSKSRGENKSFADYMRAAANDERLANIACVVGFIAPRLVMKEHELDGSSDCWLVTDLHLDERKRYLSFVSGNANEEDLKRLAAFRDSRLADRATA